MMHYDAWHASRGKVATMGTLSKELLAKATGVAPGNQKAEQRIKQYEDLCGVWSQEEYDEFMETLDEMRQIDPEDWK
jgi:hypothetical protein